MIPQWNEVIDYLAAKEEVTENYDLAILAGNSLPYLADELIHLYKQKKASAFMLVGGIGHATPFLRENFKNIGMNISGSCETEMYLDYFKLKYHLDKDQFLIETESTNSGENASFSLEKVQESDLNPRKVLLLQDPILQRRTKETFHKEWQETHAHFTNYVPIVPFVKTVDERITFEDNRLNGLWNKDYFFSLVLGEIDRLRNDENGYGPNGRNYIGAVEIPESVQLAYEQLCQVYDYKQKR
ncbi:ElyC/SanA/YdcF family protein [Enterococcus quebecensis]|uniref:Uncharacterized protein n=1 Tax=Enterococcus quebecensis TaxID=903983 RepID=A0A1E5GU85_9ENTE|nr:ElyC/SanA/YdcF family protein [Enterococcus quebecensis]OEG16229.1 hypothetical protein BCR23_04905 [Enterococcus quebecensis]OJG74498.1 hypothetical protein RV12_GL002555 [Enterococcus quebecensis]